MYVCVSYKLLLLNMKAQPFKKIYCKLSATNKKVYIKTLKKFSFLLKKFL